MKRLLLLFLLLPLAGCPNQAAKAPVPGSINTLDAYAFRVVGDAHAAIMSIKGWETCSDQKFPSIVTFDNATFTCDATAGAFPQAARQPLYIAESAYNVALAAGTAYHSGASQDAQGLTNAVNALSTAISQLLTAAGRSK